LEVGRVSLIGAALIGYRVSLEGVGIDGAWIVGFGCKVLSLVSA
jgi:hypothetical protein